MKQIKFITLMAMFFLPFIALSQSMTLEMLELEEAKRTPLLTAHSEVILIGNTPWERLYGESEFVLSPAVEDVHSYNSKVARMSLELGDRNLTRFGFFNVEISDLAIRELFAFGVLVPSYYKEESIKVMIPKCHYMYLKSMGIDIEADLNYGNYEFESNTDLSQNEVVFYSQGFEQANIPFSISNTGSADCGWGRENCGSYTGNWSVWCSNTGADCEDCSGGEHINDVSTLIQPTSWIDVAQYTNRTLSYAIWSDLNDADLVDYTTLLYALNGQAQNSISISTYYSNSSIDEIGWTIRELLFTTPNINTFTYGFLFYSDWLLRSTGVYLDDIKISGTLITDVEESETNVGLVYPNPTSGIFSIRDIGFVGDIQIFDSAGKLCFSSNEKTVDLAGLGSGVYILSYTSKAGKIYQRIIKE